MLIIGIDPGKNGGISLVSDTHVKMMSVCPLLKSGEYSIEDMKTLLEEYSDEGENPVVIERQAAQPIQGVKSAFNMGYGFGIWETLLICLNIPYEVVRPKEWQKELFNRLSKNERKNTKSASAQIAQRLFPKVDFRKSDRAKNVHDGLTDATCIAVYGRRHIWV